MLRSVVRTSLLVAIAATGVSACKPKDAGASCSAVAGQFFKVATDTLAADKTLDASTRRQVHDQLPAMRDSMDTACTKGTWDRAVRDCIAIATDHAAIETCEQRLTPAQRSTLDKTAPAEDPSR